MRSVTGYKRFVLLECSYCTKLSCIREKKTKSTFENHKRARLVFCTRKMLSQNLSTIQLF